MMRSLTTSEKFKAAMEYINSTPSPDQSLCPELMQYFTCSRGYMVYNNKTGERTINNDLEEYRVRHTRNIVPVRPDYHGLYVKYIPELDALELSELKMNGNRGQEGVRRDWYWASKYNRHIIFRDDVNCYQYGCILKGNKYYCKDLIKSLRNINLPLISKEAYDEFKKFNGGKEMMMRYGQTNFPYPWHYIEWYQRHFISRTRSKQASSLSEYQFADLWSDEINIAMQSCSTRYLAVFEQLDDTNCCIRFISDLNYRWHWQTSQYSHENPLNMREDLRIFINAKGKPTSMIPTGDTWTIAANLGYRGNQTFTLANRALAATWMPLKYILPILQHNTVDELLAMFRHPIVEQLAKAGYPNIAKRLTACGQVNAALRDDFGVEKVTKQPMYRLLGVNKYLLAEAESQIAQDGNFKLISQIKKLYDRFDVSDLSKETVTILACGLYRGCDLRQLLKDYTGGWWRSQFTVYENDRKNLMRLFRMQMNDDNSRNYTMLWMDILLTWKGLHDKPDLDLYSFKNWNDLERMHNALVQLKLVEDANRAAQYSEAKRRDLERYQKDFDALQADRSEKFEYENDQFAVRVPKALTEITQEGMMLHHCVGGYVHSHASGETNIIFLRRRDEENVPFYTIEIRGNHVIQIHGNHNRWLGNNPEAVPFMYNYLMHLGVHFDTQVLLNCGSGYSPSTINLPESSLFAVSA